MSGLIFSVVVCLSGRDNVVIEAVFDDAAACDAWALSYWAQQPGFVGYSAEVIGTVTGRVAAVWTAMAARHRAAMVARHRATMGRLISGGVPAAIAFRVGHNLMRHELTELAMKGEAICAPEL